MHRACCLHYAQVLQASRNLYVAASKGQHDRLCNLFTEHFSKSNDAEILSHRGEVTALCEALLLGIIRPISRKRWFVRCNCRRREWFECRPAGCPHALRVILFRRTYVSNKFVFLSPDTLLRPVRAIGRAHGSARSGKRGLHILC